MVPLQCQRMEARQDKHDNSLDANVEEAAGELDHAGTVCLNILGSNLPPALDAEKDKHRQDRKLNELNRPRDTKVCS